MTSETQTSTTFVQADTATFRHLVQQLTGLPGAIDPSEALPVKHPSKLSPRTSNRRSPIFKLQDRRHAMRNKLEIKLGLSAINQNHSPSKIHRVGSLGHSPVTPLGPESMFFWGLNMESPVVLEEEKAITAKGFYLHPSPANTPRGAEPPALLPLFPVTSPEQES
ncbi:VQ motif-containing protein 4-like [Punica granatum]|uniref:VQ domain-containing protein n=2 Tax=Punica granatum TaxID=22663 RepID=A0A218XPE3_PUNGR|nr:VQ motif-containing protein 4-like [Punica granatum]OWM86823.1 hypothetical protein CDL15_Pgr015859 [Punica granatum]PKI37154.1 hypothetical protein CRG98_042489 [Punica granatum]